MSKRLVKEFQKLEQQTDAFFKMLQIFSKEQLSYQPDGNAWSMLDVVEHLISVESGVNRFFKKYPPNNSQFRMNIKNHILSWLMQYYLKAPSRLKAPSYLPPPKGDTSLEDWRAIWAKERQQLKHVVETLEPSKESASVFKHGISGPMNMFHVINFQKNHIIHHIHQVKRIKNHKGFPKS